MKQPGGEDRLAERLAEAYQEGKARKKEARRKNTQIGESALTNEYGSKTPEQEKAERIEGAVKRAIELIESDSDFEYFMMLYPRYIGVGNKDLYYNRETRKIEDMRSDRKRMDQIPLYSNSVTDETRRPPFKFYGQIRVDERLPDKKIFMLWMNLGDSMRGSQFASALRWSTTEEALKKCKNEALENYLGDMADEKEFSEFSMALMDECNKRFHGSYLDGDGPRDTRKYWEWVKTLLKK